jgi:2Fe-2S ferredoxin
MATINYRHADGAVTAVNADHGSVMQAAVRNDISGIEGECGGELSCATCHVFVCSSWKDKVGDASYDERDLLEMVENTRPESRLSCQIKVTAELDGLIVDVPGASF